MHVLFELVEFYPLVQHLVSKILAKIQGTEKWVDLEKLGTRYSHYLVPRSSLKYTVKSDQKDPFMNDTEFFSNSLSDVTFDADHESEVNSLLQAKVTKLWPMVNLKNLRNNRLYRHLHDAMNNSTKFNS
jgi:hypothetical protein